MLKVYNTLTKNLEEFKPIKEKKVSFYHCGPTVYWVQHIGNMRGMTLADLIRRSLVYLGNDVTFVRNYTDVGHLTGDNIGDADSGEDRMEKASKRENLDPQTIAKKYIDSFEAHTSALNILEPDHKPVASNYIEQMQELIKKLIKEGFAYETDKAVYFEVSKFPKYTELSGQVLEKNRVGEGKGDVNDTDKRSPHDFALWFFKTGAHKNALQYWPSPFTSNEVENGEGIPGWHIECSAMAGELLGKTIDFHMGGVEHISIHHTNEIAQSESANGVKFVNYWLHNEHLLIDGKKMSKSEGTAYILDDLIDKGFDPIVLRYFFLNAHYRSKQNFTWEALQGANLSYKRLKKQVNQLQNTKEKGEIAQLYKERFVQALENDFNIPEALALLWELIKSEIKDADKLETIKDFDRVLGLNLLDNTKVEINPEAQELIEKRQLARKLGNWTESDELRDRLKEEFAVVIEDTPEGQRVVS
ncbi:MAG TPA: cysteine--tRNA ligase [Candidatus Dojkabacteria bacterium]|nr:cysteine--tRNA ligase [Candidatus Dojkabacteria bacterium]HRO65346.1 cysteine--tRNA ligase [Candidatus Dojkabacteria bacterium]